MAQACDLASPCIVCRRSGRLGPLRGAPRHDYPTDPHGWYPRHKCELRYVSNHDGSGGNEAIFSKRVAANNGRVSTDGSAPLDKCSAEFVPAHNLRAGIRDIGEHAARPAEHVVFELDASIKADVVLKSCSRCLYSRQGRSRHFGLESSSPPVCSWAKHARNARFSCRGRSAPADPRRHFRE